MDIVKIIIAIALVLVLVIGGWTYVTTLVQGSIEYTEKNEAVKAGVIIDKQISTSGGLFHAPTVVYCFSVSAEIEYNDELCSIEKTFIVTENVYNHYSVGDWFDSQNLIVPEETVEESAA